MKTWIKICGTTNLMDAQAAVSAGADALGFIFTDSRRRLEPDQVKTLVAELPEHIEKIGVFVNEPADRVMEIAHSVGLTGVQLHGDESPKYVAGLKEISSGRIKIIKSISASVDLQESRTSFSGSEEYVDAFMVDSGNIEMRGGTGQVFDWLSASDFVVTLQSRARVIIAGGLNPQNVAAAVGLFHPWGVDVVTGVEREYGQKDHERLRSFISAVRQADTQSSATAH